MKSQMLLLALCVAPAAASASSSAELFASFGAPKDAGSVVQKLTGMMAAAKQQLGLAERRHGKVVKKVRKEAGAALEDEAKAYGNYINGYSAELEQAETSFRGVLTSVKAGLAKSEAESSKVSDWKDPDTEKRARLSAQLTAADRNLNRAQRKAGRQAREAEERSEEVLEDEGSKLAMKVGDMTPLVDKAKKTLEAVAEKKVAAAASTASALAEKNKKVNLTALEGDLAKASAAHQKVVAAANKKLDGFLTKTDKDVAAKVAQLQDNLEKKQREEISKILPGGAKKVAAAKPAPKKPAPAKAVASKVAPAAVKATAAAKTAKLSDVKVAPVEKPMAAKAVAPSKVAKPSVVKVAPVEKPSAVKAAAPAKAATPSAVKVAAVKAH